MGEAETTMKMIPSTKSKMKTTRLDYKDRQKFKYNRSGKNNDQNDSKKIMGGYGPVGPYGFHYHRIMDRIEQ